MVTPKKIIVDGKEFPNFEALPWPLKKVFTDANKDGIPDIFETLIANQEKAKLLSRETPTLFMAEGKAYHSFKDLPPELQKTVQEKLGINIQSSTDADPLWKSQNIHWESGQFNTGSKDYTKLFVVLAVLAAILLLGLGAAFLLIGKF